MGKGSKVATKEGTIFRKEKGEGHNEKGRDTNKEKAKILLKLNVSLTLKNNN